MGFWSWMRENVFSPIGRGFVALAEFTQQQIEERRKYVATMDEIGWPATKLGDWDTQRIVLATLTGRTPTQAKREIEDALTAHFSEARLEALLAEWLSFDLAKDREDILRQIIQAHNAGLYAMTVPVVHAQIDGMLATTFRLEGRATNVPWKRLSRILADAPWKNSANHVVGRFVDTKVLANFERGRPLTSDHSRHAIAHGHDIRYGSKANSLKAILLLDYVVWSIRDVRLVEGNIYHIPTCPRITEHFDSLGVIRNPLDFLMRRHQMDVRPCLHCNANFFASRQGALPASIESAARSIRIDGPLPSQARRPGAIDVVARVEAPGPASTETAK